MQDRIQIGLVSRPRSHYNSRAIVNEEQLLMAMHERYQSSADARLLSFDSTLSMAMLEASHMHILIGTHGAGMGSQLALLSLS